MPQQEMQMERNVLGCHRGRKQGLRLEKQEILLSSWRTHDIPTSYRRLPGSFSSSNQAPNKANCPPTTAAILGVQIY